MNWAHWFASTGRRARTRRNLLCAYPASVCTPLCHCATSFAARPGSSPRAEPIRGVFGSIILFMCSFFDEETMSRGRMFVKDHVSCLGMPGRHNARVRVRTVTKASATLRTATRTHRRWENRHSVGPIPDAAPAARRASRAEVWRTGELQPRELNNVWCSSTSTRRSRAREAD